MNTYCYMHLRGEGRDHSALRDALTGHVFGAWRQAGITVWGVWEGIFGVASNELLVVAAASGQRDQSVFTAALGGEIELLDSLLLKATARPEGLNPCENPGLYVFRFFDVQNQDVEEIARLSALAWQTFEGGAGYQAEPQGLFAEAEAGTGPGTMLLVTWYDGLDSWQTSRQPAPEAMENFRRRRNLTSGTRALATRLVAPLFLTGV